MRNKPELLNSIPEPRKPSVAVLLSYLAQMNGHKNRRLGGIRGLDIALNRIGQQPAQIEIVKAETQLFAKSVLYARHGRPLENKLGKRFLKTPSGHRKTKTDCRNYDAQTCPRRFWLRLSLF